MFREDFLMRMVRQLLEAGARAMGLRIEAPQAALEEVERAKARLPLVPGTLEEMSAASVIQLLGSPDAALGLAQLYRAESAIRAQLGDATAARRTAKRALQFFAQAKHSSPGSAADVAAFRELAAAFEPEELPNALREALELGN